MEAADTRSRILSNAVELFTAHGYEQTSLRELADRVGITKASLYYHYPSKQALLLAILQPFVDEWRRLVDTAVQTPRTPASVRGALGSCVDAMLRNSAVCVLLNRDAASVVAALAPVIGDLTVLRDRMQAWLAGPGATPVERLRAIAANEAIKAAFVAAGTVPEMSDDEVRETLLDAALAVLGPPVRIP